MNYVYIARYGKTPTKRGITSVWYRTGDGANSVYCGSVFDEGHSTRTCYRFIGICPSLQYKLSSINYDIRDVKDKNGKVLYYTLQIGEYPKTKADENISRKLELLYNGGQIQRDLLCTGRWYSGNGQKDDETLYAGKHSPEFEYHGVRYVRVVSYPKDVTNRYSDGVLHEETGTIRWVKVEPISFVINNWNEMPRIINPRGNGRAKFFDLRAEEAITSNIPFYPDEYDCNSTMWQNSTARGFLNGIDVRNITTNGNSQYGAKLGGNFTGECNFLNEAFNLSREPITEYVIPDSETVIPDDSFNGCITLKKIVIHPGVKSIGKRAFEGVQFKYAYRLETGELILSQELPKNKEVVELDKVRKVFNDFNYNILIQSDRFKAIQELTEYLIKNKFIIPYAYGAALIKNRKESILFEHNDFRFFKAELPHINEILQNYRKEERLDFFKFARCLGCFSTETFLDEEGKRTEVTIAQKASSLLAILLKTEEMRLRTIS